MDQQDALQNLFLQFAQGQLNLQNAIQALANAQQGLLPPTPVAPAPPGAPGAPPAAPRSAKKIVADGKPRRNQRSFFLELAKVLHYGA